MDTFGEWLRQQRSQRNLSRREFADRVGCSVAMLRKIEDGERRPSTQIAELIANCLDVPPAERPAFVKVARGELSVNRLSPVLEQAPTAPPPHTNLPVLPTPLIGRQSEVEELSQLLNDPLCRLLTLVGPGGIGKTRLALEVAAQVQETFVDGVYFVPFASVNSTRYIVPLVADALGFAFPSANPSDPKAQLFNYLKEKQTLLLTDNLEHLLAEPGIEVLAELLANAPQIKLLATSRETLGLQGEWVFEVRGLPIPEGRYVEESTQNTAVELFLQRARRAHVGFAATLEDYPAIVRICQLVDGMPLGVELAAAWVRTLTCGEIAQEIERGLGFLSGSAHSLPARHRSMRAVFDHSWRLLTQEEQGALLRLSAFQGGFRREAAEVVAGASLPTLSALLTKSLIQRSGAGRYGLHELIGQFAAELIAARSGEQAALQERHGRYYLDFFSQADQRLRSSEQRQALAELTAEIDNFRAAWAWAVAQGEFALIEKAMRTFTMFYDTRGWFQEGFDTLGSAIRVLDAAHERSPLDRINRVALGHILASRALLASRLGLSESAQAMLERSLQILQPLDEPRVLVEALIFYGMTMELTGSYPRAWELYSQGLEIATALGDRWFSALGFTCLTGLAGFIHNLAEPEDIYEQFQSAVADWRRIGDPRLTAIALHSLSLSALRVGRYEEARAALKESVTLSMSVDDRWGLGYAYRGLAIIAQTQEDHLQAVDLFHTSLEILSELGARQDEARVLAEMGRSLFVLGDEAGAGHTWQEALRLASETGMAFITLEALVGLASLQARQGNTESALEWLLLVMGHPACLRETRDRATRLCHNLETQLAEQQLEAIRDRVQAKTFEAVVDEALEKI
jgi:predicted ATPase/DNA-binding XRE family transcriptional regulator